MRFNIKGVSSLHMLNKQSPIVFFALLTFFIHFPAQAFDPLKKLCSYYFSAQMSQERVIRRGKFVDARPFDHVVLDMPWLQEKLTSLPPGSTVLELGSGRGFTLASIVGTSGLEQSPTRLQYQKDFAHLNFIGVTRTGRFGLVVKRTDPGGRYVILTGQLFQHLQASKIIKIYGQPIAAAFDELGVFTYSPRPDLDLRILKKVLIPTADVFVHGAGAKIQLKDGSFIGLVEYIKIFASNTFDVRIFERPISKDFSQNKDPAWDLDFSITLKSNAEPLELNPLELIEVLGRKPGIRIFRILYADMTQEETLRNQNLAEEEIRTQTERLMAAMPLMFSP